MTKIEWTDETWNPIIGCEKISPGCKNCYAEKMAHRLAHNPKAPTAYQHVTNHEGKWNGLTELNYPALLKPLKWKKPRKIFVCSMGDLFHESISFDTILAVFQIMWKCPHHTFQILTKRPKRMHQFIFNNGKWDVHNLLTKNIWLGVTCENQEMANKRIPILLKIPSAVRFVSIEPMLNTVNLKMIEQRNSKNKIIAYYQVLTPITQHGDSNRYALNWVICGGETGLGARNIEEKWVIDLKNQCQKYEVPFFFKSYGTSRKELKGNNLVEGKYYHEFPKTE